jgi:hypothetical protein
MGQTAVRIPETNEEEARGPVGSPSRKVIPWSDIEKRLATALAAKAAAKEAETLDEPPSKPWTRDSAKVSISPEPPSSSVRAKDESVDGQDLTYRAYTVAELEAQRRQQKPAPPTTPDAQPSRWPDVQRSAVNLARAWWRGWVCARPRPRLLDVCSIPFQQLLTDFTISLRGVAWRKLALASALSIGALVVLLGLVLTTAELTDDLKPKRASLVAQRDDVAQAPAAAAQVKAPEPEPAAAPTIEIDEAPSPPPAANAKMPVRAPVVRAVREKKPGTLLVPLPTMKKRSGELFKP